MQFKAFLIFGAPGSGKGTQGRILGMVPGFVHVACGDVFRGLDLQSNLGRAFLQYSGRGELVPDDVTVDLWKNHINKIIAMGQYKPDMDVLVLDGIPRNLSQAKMLQSHLQVIKIFHLSCPKRDLLVERMQRRALSDNRLDDAKVEIIRARLQTYEDESRPVLDFYGVGRTVEIDATKYPYQVLRNMLQHIDTHPVPADNGIV